MAVDGDIDCSGYTGAELLRALDQIDRDRYPRNLQAVRNELERRPAPGRSVIEGSEIAEFNALPDKDRRALLRDCMRRVFWLQIQFSLLGAVLSVTAGIIVRSLTSGGSKSTVAGLTSVIMFTMSFAAFWAYTKWLLHEPINGFTFRLLRLRRDDA
jgi:hypothetical protein